MTARLARNVRIQALASNPLLLSLIILVYEQDLDLPERRAELYERCINILLIQWDTERKVLRRREFNLKHKTQLLGEIAWRFHQQNRRYFPSKALLHIIQEFLPAISLGSVEDEKASVVLAEIANAHGLLKEQAIDWYSFLHFALQEFFASKYAIDHACLQDLFKHIGNDWWEEVLLLYAARVSDASGMLRSLLGRGNLRQPEDVFGTNILLAGMALSTKPTVLEVSLQQEIIQALFNLLIMTPYTLVKERAANTLATIGGHDINERLLALLADDRSDVEVRGNIAQALGMYGDRSLALKLYRLLLCHPINRYVCGKIVHALGEIGNQDIVSPLLELLGKDQVDWYVRQNLVTVVGKLGGKSVAMQLLAQLRNPDVHEAIRQSCAITLGSLGISSLMPELIELLWDRQCNRYVRGSIATALATFKDASLLPLFLGMLADVQVDPYVQQCVATALGALGNRDCVPPLVDLLCEQQTHPFVRRNIAITLGNLGDCSIIPRLHLLLNDEQEDKDVRGSVAIALVMLGEQHIVSQLLALLRDDQVNQDVRANIAATLGTLAARRVVPSLLSAFTTRPSTNRYVQRSIALAFGSLGTADDVPTLLALLVNRQLDRSVRRGIIEALAQLITQPQDLALLGEHLHTSPELSDDVHRALWLTSRRLKIRILHAVDQTQASLDIRPC